VARSTTARRVQDSGIIQYFRETYFELKKVSWPTRREGVNLTVIVILVTTFLAIVLGLLDWIYSMIFGLFL
jgi:preprotein translocase subunit SecE